MGIGGHIQEVAKSAAFGYSLESWDRKMLSLAKIWTFSDLCISRVRCSGTYCLVIAQSDSTSGSLFADEVPRRCFLGTSYWAVGAWPCMNSVLFLLNDWVKGINTFAVNGRILLAVRATRAAGARVVQWGQDFTVESRPLEVRILAAKRPTGDLRVTVRTWVGYVGHDDHCASLSSVLSFMEDPDLPVFKHTAFESKKAEVGAFTSQSLMDQVLTTLSNAKRAGMRFGTEALISGNT
ncbi:hypothetical protein DFP72DRAFT_848623 [Ephemerocybe angulata]|uniref:Uncharacterized protein n=1 Tax=Ephemerocybe angulata TaxID=980116 RepID=A0A8H6HXC3_9AGAR|nr:hypothetical protein DFP72DRAFT_848623 [Tulosesus angulatus]